MSGDLEPHDERHDEWLALRLAGEPLPPEAERALAACPECARGAASLADLEGVLEDIGHFERKAFERAFAPAPVAARRLRPRPVVLAALAALALLAIVPVAIRFATREDEPDRGVMLGSGALHILSPRGAVAAVERFEWEGEAPSEGGFRAYVYDARATDPKPLIESALLSETHWTPSAAELSSLPPRVPLRLAVHSVDATGGDVLAPASASFIVEPD